ncbi:MAG: lyase family protein, partial [Ignisphaera sp.]
MKRYKVFVGGVSKDSIDSYVSSIDFDRKLAKYVAMVMLAHLKNLVNSHLITIETAKKISYELIKIIETEGRRLYEWIEKREEKFEDVFEALEIYLFSVVGEDAGRIAIGRSRNDHISAVLRLSIRDHMIKLLLKLLDLREAFIDKSNKYRETLFPFFTHAQLAQCGSA